MESKLLAAASSGDVKDVRKLMLEVSNINSCANSKEMTALHCASKSGHVEVVIALVFEFNRLLRHTKDWYGYTPLHYACMYGHLDVVRVLATKFPADLTAREDYGCTPLHCACECGELGVVHVLISEFKVDCTMKDDYGKTPLYCACRKGYLDIVRLLVRELNSDPTMQDKNGNTPLHCASENGHLMIVRALISEFNADTSSVNAQGCTPLHCASENGHFEVVRELVSKFKSDYNARDTAGRTPLHCASTGDVIRVLVSEFSADPSPRDSTGRTPLHCACTGDVVRVLVSEFSADPSARDSAGRTPLHCASERNHVDITKVLVSEFSADPSARDSAGRTSLHCASERDYLDVAELLVYKFKADHTIKDNQGCTPVHLACKNRSVNIVRLFAKITNNFDGCCPLHFVCEIGQWGMAGLLISEFKVDYNIKDTEGCTPLHIACRRGHVDVVRMLLSNNADHIIQDNCGNTPLHYASKNGHVSVVRFLASQSKANLSKLNVHGHSPLHCASRNGHVEVVISLLFWLQADHTLIDSNGRTALHLASEQGHLTVVQQLGALSPSTINVQDKFGRTPLLCASESGKGKVVKELVVRFNADLAIKDKRGYTIDPNIIVNQSGETLLHVASASGDCSLVLALVKMGANVNCLDRDNRTPLNAAVKSNDFSQVASILLDNGADHSIRGWRNRTPLHFAALGAHFDVLAKLLKLCSPFLTDDLGNTPLHYASECDHLECVMTLVESNAPLFVRNERGETPVDVAALEAKAFLTSYIKENRNMIATSYEKALKFSKRRYSGSNYVTRMFVLGNPGAGKSTFVESLKREGFFQSLWAVTVPPHTAGIIPSVFVSEQYGRVMFYDFAGDAEYYSSHAAIFECLASSKKGSNLFIIVVDLSQDNGTIKTTLYYWFSFIQYERYTKPLLIVVGSHYDLSKKSSEKAQLLKEFCASIHEYTADSKAFLLDCRDARSSQITQFRKQILGWVCESPKYDISHEASILLGLLEKDFREVAACPVETLNSHIKDCGVWLPESLHEVLLELHEVGLVLLLGDCTKSSDQVILDIPKLTTEVHELLFSEKAVSKLQKSQQFAPFNVGILPEAFLAEILPPYITKECLICLQYCQQISQSSVSMFPALEHINSEGLLYFPALCTADKSKVSWDVSSSSEFCIGWLALCSDPHDYFPKRFHHVLLLRLVYSFTRPVPEELQTAHTSPVYSRRCTMWKSGVQWSTVKGVKCMVELVNESKGIVVLSRSSKGRAQECIDTFLDVVNCVLQAKVEFCQTIHPQYFFLDSVDEADYLNKDHQFFVSEVEEDLAKGSAVSISLGRGEAMLDLSQLQCLRRRTQWNTLFPIDYAEVLHVLRVVVCKIVDLALCLGAPSEFIKTLQALPLQSSSDIDQRRQEVVSWWMDSCLDPPCWWTLVEALKDIDMGVLAGEIRHEHSVDVELQEKMLDEENKDKKPDEKFLHSLSGVVGSRWPSVAVTLSLSSDDIEELNEKAGLHQPVLAFQMLKTWSLKEDATYGQLCCKFRAISIFQHSK